MRIQAAQAFGQMGQSWHFGQFLAQGNFFRVRVKAIVIEAIKMLGQDIENRIEIAAPGK
ncbi:hypothetical protein [Massilia sp. 9096]|uniref:hypothetical protein n=1 Tax=Massilia sp. 9096 TaxID=1500894 RepID=UPI0018CF79C6|nr:hypothetical protein [Massilia sp. 9096]